MSSSVRGAGGGGPSEAKKVSYDNTASGMNAKNVQDAVDELNINKADKTELAEKAPMWEKSQTDITAGTTPLTDNKLYLVYE